MHGGQLALMEYLCACLEPVQSSWPRSLQTLSICPCPRQLSPPVSRGPPWCQCRTTPPPRPSITSALSHCLPATLDPHQFPYHHNRSTEDAISTALHAALTHLDSHNPYVRMLFVDFSSAFNTVIKLISTFCQLGCHHIPQQLGSRLSD